MRPQPVEVYETEQKLLQCGFYHETYGPDWYGEVDTKLGPALLNAGYRVVRVNNDTDIILQHKSSYYNVRIKQVNYTGDDEGVKCCATVFYEMLAPDESCHVYEVRDSLGTSVARYYGGQLHGNDTKALEEYAISKYAAEHSCAVSNLRGNTLREAGWRAKCILLG